LQENTVRAKAFSGPFPLMLGRAPAPDRLEAPAPGEGATTLANSDRNAARVSLLPVQPLNIAATLARRT